MKKEKTFLHIDGDAFFVACSIAMHPELEGKPVVTGHERGIVTAVSPEAKALGVTRTMPIYKVKKYFPKVIIIESDYNAITVFSKRMTSIVKRYVPIVEEYSIDECFGDISNLYLNSGRQINSNSSSKINSGSKINAEGIARKIQKEIKDNLNISVSIGVGPTKVLAKVASKYKKPFGITVITQENKSEYLKNVPVGDVWGIGSRTSAFLEQSGIKNAQQFAELSEKWIDATLTKPFIELWHELRGNSLLSVNGRGDSMQKSISKTGTFNPPSRSPLYVFAELSKNIENACLKMRNEGLRGKRAVMFVKRQDFKYHSIECIIPYPTNSPEDFIAIAKERFAEMFKDGEDYRATGFTVYDLSPLPFQKDLFGHTDKTDRFEKIHEAVDSIDSFLGKHIVHLGTSAKAIFQKNENRLMSNKNSRIGNNDGVMANSYKFFEKLAIPFGGVVS